MERASGLMLLFFRVIYHLVRFGALLKRSEVKSSSVKECDLLRPSGFGAHIRLVGVLVVFQRAGWFFSLQGQRLIQHPTAPLPPTSSFLPPLHQATFRGDERDVANIKRHGFFTRDRRATRSTSHG